MTAYIEILKQPFQLLRRLLSISIIVVSIPLAVYVAVTVAEILTSRSASARYNKALVEFYLKAKDWETIHFLERTITTGDLDATYLDLYDKQFWNNYMQDPQEYWFIGREKDKCQRRYNSVPKTPK